MAREITVCQNQRASLTSGGGITVSQPACGSGVAITSRFAIAHVAAYPLCNGKFYCALPAADVFFGYPSPLQTKNLRIRYQCSPDTAALPTTELPSTAFVTTSTAELTTTSEVTTTTDLTTTADGLTTTVELTTKTEPTTTTELTTVAELTTTADVTTVAETTTVKEPTTTIFHSTTLEVTTRKEITTTKPPSTSTALEIPETTLSQNRGRLSTKLLTTSAIPASSVMTTATNQSSGPDFFGGAPEVAASVMTQGGWAGVSVGILIVLIVIALLLMYKKRERTVYVMDPDSQQANEDTTRNAEYSMGGSVALPGNAHYIVTSHVITLAQPTSALPTVIPFQTAANDGGVEQMNPTGQGCVANDSLHTSINLIKASSNEVRSDTTNLSSVSEYGNTQS